MSVVSAVSCAPPGACKTVHFIRHAQAESNAAAEAHRRRSPEYWAAYEDRRYFDSVLTEAGKQMCRERCDQFKAAPQKYHVEAVISSPMRRALQTAAIVFDSPGITRLAVEAARETSSGHAHPCNNRRSREEQMRDFPEVDFSAVPQGEDTFSVKNETMEDVDRRIHQLLRFLAARQERELAVVSHKGFLTRLFTEHFGWHADMAPFANCELRSMVLQFRDLGSVVLPDS